MRQEIPTRAKAQIMVVEDEAIVALDIRTCLLSLGYAVPAVAASGEEAIQKATDTRPDLVLMDIKLKGEMDGVAAAHHLRDRFNLPVVYLTAHADEPTVQRAKVTEAFGYLLKPFDKKELQTAIEVALYKHQAEQRLRQSEERYALAARGANDGLWDWDLHRDEVYFSPRWKSMLGWEEGEIGMRPDEWFQRVHPDDLEPLQRAISWHLQGLTAHLETEYRLLHKDGGYRWMLGRGLAVRDVEGKAYRLAGSQTEKRVTITPKPGARPAMHCSTRRCAPAP
jgi:PAS domain S-box-containing protein